MFSRRVGVRVLFTFILPREAGKGDRPAEQDGRKGVDHVASSTAARPLHRANARSPAPASFHYAGADKRTHSRDADAPESCLVIARSASDEAIQRGNERSLR